MGPKWVNIETEVFVRIHGDQYMADVCVNDILVVSLLEIVDEGSFAEVVLQKDGVRNTDPISILQDTLHPLQRGFPEIGRAHV